MAHRAGLVLGWLQGLKANAAQSFREVRLAAQAAGRAPLCKGLCLPAAAAPTRRPHPTPPDAAGAGAAPAQPSSASHPPVPQAKPWSEVLDRTAFAKPEGMAEVRSTRGLANRAYVRLPRRRRGELRTPVWSLCSRPARHAAGQAGGRLRCGSCCRPARTLTPRRAALRPLCWRAGHEPHAQERGVLQGQLRHRDGVPHRPGEAPSRPAGGWVGKGSSGPPPPPPLARCAARLALEGGSCGGAGGSHSCSTTHAGWEPMGRSPCSQRTVPQLVPQQAPSAPAPAAHPLPCPPSSPAARCRQVMFMNPWSLIVLALLALLWGYAYIVRTTPLVMGGRELRCARRCGSAHSAPRWPRCRWAARAAAACCGCRVGRRQWQRQRRPAAGAAAAAGSGSGAERPP